MKKDKTTRSDLEQTGQEYVQATEDVEDHETDQVDDWRDELYEHLHKFDQAHEPVVPNLHEFESFVRTHKNDLVRKRWKDLLLLWLTALIIISAMMWMLEHKLVWFSVLQLVVLASSVLILSVTSRKQVRRR